LFSCQNCFERFQAGAPAAEWISIDLGEPPAGHDLLYEQLEKYVDDEMSPGERTSFELHLNGCGVCKQEVADLLDLKSEMAGNEARPRLDGVAVPVKTGSASIPAPWYGQPIGILAAAAAALLLAVVLSWVISLPLRNEIANLKQRIKSLEQDNELAIRQAGSRIEDLSGRLSDLESRSRETQDQGSGPGTGLREATVSLRDGGHLIGLEGGALRGLEPVSAASRKAVEAALTTSSLHMPPAGGLLGKPSALMGPAPDAGSLSVNSPVGVVVEEDRPLFTWNPVAGATGYTVVISRSNSSKLVTSGPVDGNEWRATTRLTRGAVYSWEVRATLAGGRELSAPAPPAPMARFRVVSESEERGLEEARRLSPQSHLLLGVLYARAGLARPARSELRALLKENPGSVVAGKLLSSLDHRRVVGLNRVSN
jgi:hypothetical protein